MKSKKGMIGELLCIVFGLLLFIVFCWSMISLVHDYTKYKEYDNFCVSRPNFCYCNLLTCEFKTSWSSMNGLSNETKELCNLAKRLDDKETIFKAGCET